MDVHVDTIIERFYALSVLKLVPDIISHFFNNRCRLVEEVIEPNVTRALLLFSPMYTARSALPNPMRLLVTGSGNDKNLAYEASLRGREELVQVNNKRTFSMRSTYRN